MYVSILKMMVPLMIAFFIGILFRKKGIVDSNGCNAVKALLSKVLIPVIIFDCMLFSNYSRDTVVMIAVTMVAIAFSFGLGCLFKKILPSRSKYFPFAVTTWEGGSLGIHLCAMIYGQAGRSKMVLLDCGHTMVVFLILIPILRQLEDNKSGFKNIIKTVFSSECIDAILIGATCGLCGLGRVIEQSQFMDVYSTTVSSITGSTTFLMMFTIGYGFELRKDILKDVGITALSRFVIMGLAFALEYVLLSRFMNIDKGLLGILMIAFTLPPSFGLFSLGKFTGHQDYLSAVMSSYTIFSLLCFVLVAIFLA